MQLEQGLFKFIPYLFTPCKLKELFKRFGKRRELNENNTNTAKGKRNNNMELKINCVFYTFQLKYVSQLEEKSCQKWSLRGQPRSQGLFPCLGPGNEVAKRQQLEFSNVMKPSTLKPREICVSAGVMQVIFNCCFHFIPNDFWAELEGLTKHFKVFELFWPCTKSPLNSMVKDGEDWHGPQIVNFKNFIVCNQKFHHFQVALTVTLFF